MTCVLPPSPPTLRSTPTPCESFLWAPTSTHCWLSLTQISGTRFLLSFAEGRIWMMPRRLGEGGGLVWGCWVVIVFIFGLSLFLFLLS